MAAARFPLFLFLFLLLAVAYCAAQDTGPRFQCRLAKPNCTALAGYQVDNATTYGDIIQLFQAKATDLYRFNNLSATTSASSTVQNGTLVRVPFPCACANDTGVANPAPVYTVVSGDDLYNIAASKFKGLLVYQQIVAFNSIIKNESLIEVGWELRIPLPCSCDMVNGEEAVHLAYIVKKGDSLEEIATRFGTTQSILSRVNNISNPGDLKEGQVLDVPLQRQVSAGGPASPPSSASPPGSVSPPGSASPPSSASPVLYAALLLLSLL